MKVSELYQTDLSIVNRSPSYKKTQKFLKSDHLLLRKHYFKLGLRNVPPTNSADICNCVISWDRCAMKEIFPSYAFIVTRRLDINSLIISCV